MNINKLFANQKITAEEFLQRYWQKRPFLFKNTNLDLSCLPSKAQLFELARQEDVQSRIIYTENSEGYQAIYDDPDAWDEVADLHPTLLVSDIEKWYPESNLLLKAFPFIKSWRLDDLMISYAPTGASVGAHTDHYDVFLIQVAGTRQWSFDNEPLKGGDFVDDSELSVLANYQAENSHELQAGDVLYLPPEVAHHGIATSDDCMTCSVGMRAPSQSEMVMAFAEFVAARCAENKRFKDQGQMPFQPQQFDAGDVAQFRNMITEACQLNDHDWQQLFGQYFSEYRQLDLYQDPPADHCELWKKNPLYTFSYCVLKDDQAMLFVNGESFTCSLKLAQTICDTDAIEDQKNDLITALVAAAYLQPLK